MKHLVVFTCAGISAESGISTFRDSDGLWENYSATQEASISGSWPASLCFKRCSRFSDRSQAGKGLRNVTLIPQTATKGMAYFRDLLLDRKW